MNLVTLERAKVHLSELPNERNDDIDSKVAEASDIIMDYLKLDDVPDEWIIGGTSPVEIAVPGSTPDEVVTVTTVAGVKRGSVMIPYLG